MSKHAEVDMRDVELNELDQEKQPMTGDGPGAEKNGSVKLKVPEEEVKFTGLSKEELMRVAGTPGWVRTRWLLLVLFWLGWLGMLAGAIVIIVQAPRCKPLPEMNWWNQGPLYLISDLAGFTGDKGLQGVAARLDSLNQLKVKGLVLGPLHTVQTDQPDTLDLNTIDPVHGTEQDLRTLLERANKKGISVVLDLTPNYNGDNVWFGAERREEVMGKLKAASEYWLSVGVDGIQVSNLDIAASSPDWAAVQAVVTGNRTEGAKKKALIGSAGILDAAAVCQQLNASDVDLLYSDVLSNPGGEERSQAIGVVLGEQEQGRVGWSLGAGSGRRLANSSGAPGSVRLNQLLLLTLPGTPVFTYGDEIGLQGEAMPWDAEKPAEGTVDKLAEEQDSCRGWFKSLSDLRGKERSLLHGDYRPLYSSASSLAFLRSWDQSERYVAAANWGSAPAQLSLSLPAAAPGQPALPEHARVRLSTDHDALKPDATVALGQLSLGAGQAVLLSFPFQG